MANMKTPGVYIVEKNAFGNSVVEAETAIPAFIGYTDKVENGNDNLKNKPFKISSMTEFVKYFGGAPKLKFDVDITKKIAENIRRISLFTVLQHDAVLCQWREYLLCRLSRKVCGG